MNMVSGSPERQSVADIGTRPVSVQELARMCELNLREMGELLEYDLIKPLPGFVEPPMFSQEIAHQLLRANRVRSDFDLDLFAVVIIMDYQLQIDALQSKIQMLTIALSERSRAPPL